MYLSIFQRYYLLQEHQRIFLDATESVHGSAGQVMEGDIVIAISNSGETLELQQTIEALKKLSIKIVSVTGGNSSWLARNTDLTLFAGVEEEGDSFNKPPRASIIAEILILQAVSIVLQEKKSFEYGAIPSMAPWGKSWKVARKEII